MKKFLSRVLFSFPFIVLFLLLLLTVFQHPCSDDFVGYYFVQKLGWQGAVHSYLDHGTGRFLAIPLFLFFTSSRFLLDHYYLFLSVFILLTYANAFFLFKWISTCFFEGKASSARLHWFAAVFLLLLLTCIPEIGSFFFWMTTDIVYLFAFNLFLLYLRSLFRLMAADTSKKVAWSLVRTCLLAVGLAGFDEISLYFSFLTSCLVLLYHVFFLKRFPLKLFWLILVQCLGIALIVMLPGNQERAAGFSSKQFIGFSAFSAFYQTGLVFFSIFSNIFFYLGLIAVSLSAGFLKPAAKQRLAAEKNSGFIGLLVLFVSLFLLFFGLRQWAGWILPLRARNIVTIYAVMGLLLIGMASSHLFEGLIGFFGKLSRRGITGALCFLTLLFLFSPFTAGLVQSLVTAPIHSAVLDKRVARIQESRRAGTRSVTLPLYGEVYEELLKQRYGAKIGSFLLVEFPPPPRCLFFRDDPLDLTGPAYAEYYGIDTVRCGENHFERWGLSGKGLWDDNK